MKRLSMLIAFILVGLGCGQSKAPAPATNQAPAKQEAPKKEAPAAAAALPAGKTGTAEQAPAAGNEQEPATAADFEDEATTDITPDNLQQQVTRLEGEIEKK